MKAFSPRKFASLSIKRQHKECAWVLRELYEQFEKGTCPLLQESYFLYCSWMKNEPSSLHSLEHISNAYHKHLFDAGIALREARLLPKINRQDRQEAQPFLNFSIYLDNLRSAHNVGSILRTVEAFRLGNIYFSKDTPWIAQKKVQDTSMGAYQHVSCLQATISELPRPLIALETTDSAIPIDQFTFPPACTIALGNEEFGCSEELQCAADFFIQIPLRGLKNSLNVSNAFAICAAQISFQYGENL